MADARSAEWRGSVRLVRSRLHPCGRIDGKSMSRLFDREAISVAGGREYPPAADDVPLFVPGAEHVRLILYTSEH